MSWYRWDGDALFLTLQLQPGAKRCEITGLHGSALKIRIQAPPVDGRANTQLLELLAELFDVPRSGITLVRGQTSRVKTVRIQSPRRMPPELLAIDPDAARSRA